MNHPISTKNSTSEPVQSVHSFRLQRRTEISNANVFHLGKDRYPINTMSNEGFMKMVHFLDKKSSPFIQLFWIILYCTQNGEKRLVATSFVKIHKFTGARNRVKNYILLIEYSLIPGEKNASFVCRDEVFFQICFLHLH